MMCKQGGAKDQQVRSIYMYINGIVKILSKWRPPTTQVQVSNRKACAFYSLHKVFANLETQYHCKWHCLVCHRKIIMKVKWMEL